MKKILAMIMALMLVCSLTAGIVVMADEATEATENATTEQVEAQEGADAGATEATEDAASSVPSDVDESSIMQYLVFDLKDAEKVILNSYITATDPTLDYYKQMYEGYGQPVEDTEYDGKRALSMGASESTKATLADVGIAYIVKEGWFCDKTYYVYTCGDMLNNYSEGQKLGVIVWEFDNKTEAHEIVAGQQNSFMSVQYTMNWINILIVVMCLVVLILLIAVVIVINKKKKTAKVAEESSEYVSEEDVYDTLVAEAENAEAVEEATEDVAEETVEEVAEETVEEKTEE